jgi:hypothetical protein
MPLLLTLKTNLKSLRYGHDRPGGGSSNQPYIQVNTKNSFDLATEELGISGGTDYLLRGGGLTPKRSLQDVSRLGKWGLDGTPPGILGLLFTAKQNTLSETNVRTQAGGILNQGVYNPLGTLLQVGTVAFGDHLNKQGLDPTGLTPASLITYSDVVNPKILGNAFSIKNKNNNRLVQLAHRKIKNSYADRFSVSLVENNITNNINSPSFISYRGGPGSVLSIGNTNIRFSDQRTGESNPLSVDSPTQFYGTYKPNFEAGKYLKSFGLFAKNTSVSGVYNKLINNPKFEIKNQISIDGGKLYQNNVYTQGNTFPEMNRRVAFTQGAATLTQEQLIKKEPISQGGQLTDFRKEVEVNTIVAKQNGMLTSSPNYQLKSIDGKRINYSSPGSKNRNRSNYTNGSGIVDAINGLYLYYRENVDTKNGITNDLVKFRFAVIDPDNPKNKTFVHFRSYFDGGISDSVQPDWSGYKYQGRGEEFFQYGGFSRNLSMGFSVVAQSKEELSIMYQKLNYLQSVMAPNYSTAGYMRGNIVQLTIGGYLYETPGVITSLDYSIPNDSTWEIGIDTNGNSDPSVKELAHRVEVKFGFKPIHNFLPEIIKPNLINSTTNISSRFISLANGTGNTANDNLYARGTDLGVNIKSTETEDAPSTTTVNSNTPTTSFTRSGGSGIGALNFDQLQELDMLNYL